MIKSRPTPDITSPFNSPVELGLRSLVILNESFPFAYSIQRLVILDYLAIHSDDLPNGPSGLHPKTPHRSSELLVRRGPLQQGLMLFQSRGLVERRFADTGVSYSATEYSSSFLDALSAPYVVDLKERAQWLVSDLHDTTDEALETLVRDNLGRWGAEFEFESVLWSEDES